MKFKPIGVGGGYRRRCLGGLWHETALSLPRILGRPFATSENPLHHSLWDAVSCRARLYVQMAKGDVVGISMTELWAMTIPGRGFHCTEGTSLEASVRFSTIASEDDRKEGARIFRERCSACHSIDGSGGPVAPALTRSQYNRGDSDLAIYKVLRDGISGTAMQSAGLTLLQRFQVISHLRSLQSQTSEKHVPRGRARLSRLTANACLRPDSKRTSG